MPTIRRINEGDPLHDLLIRACPPYKKLENGELVKSRSGVKSTTILAYSLDMSPQGVHKWIKTRKVPGDKAKRMVENNPREVSLADFAPFVYR